MSKELITTTQVETVLALVIEGALLKQAAKSLNIPLSTLYRHLHGSPEIWDAYRRARELGANAVAEDAVDIADTDLDAKRARNRIMVRQWLARCHDPKTYGDKLDLNVNQTVDISGAMAEARARVRPPCDQQNVIDAEVIERKGDKAATPGDSESVGPENLPDIFG